MIPFISYLATAAPSAADAMNTAMGTVATDALGAVTGMIPVAAPILGAIIVVGIAIKSFKKVSGNKG